MFTGFERIVEERIKKAEAKGAFNNLPGSGEPLNFSADVYVPEDLRLSYKILKNADCLPPEIELKKKIQQTEDLLSNMKDTAERFRCLKKLNFLILKLNASRNSNARFDMPQKYATVFTQRMESNKHKSDPSTTDEKRSS